MYEAQTYSDKPWTEVFIWWVSSIPSSFHLRLNTEMTVQKLCQTSCNVVRFLTPYSKRDYSKIKVVFLADESVLKERQESALGGCA